MGLLQTIEDRFIRLLSPILGPLRPLVALFTKFRDNTVGILDAASNLIETARNEYDEIKNFKSKPEWKNRVISVPKVLDNITELAQIPSRIADSVRDLIAQLKGKLQPAKLSLDDLEGIEDLRGIFGKLGTKLAAGFEKLLGAIALIVDALVTIRATIDDLQTIVDSISTVRKDLENLDGLFLSQKNPRRLEQLAEGGTIKLRIGNLHT